MTTINELTRGDGIPPPTAKKTVRAPGRRKNAEYRLREYLTPSEVERLLATAKKSRRYGQRDHTLVLLMYRHGLRVREAVELQWEQVDLDGARLHVRRKKGGAPSCQPLTGAEVRALRQLRRDWPNGPWLFCSERKGPMKTGNVRKLLTRLGKAAGLDLKVHPHMLRHACGFKLANEGQDTRAIQDFLGHRRIQHTVIYTQLSANRFKDFWKD